MCARLPAASAAEPGLRLQREREQRGCRTSPGHISPLVGVDGVAFLLRPPESGVSESPVQAASESSLHPPSGLELSDAPRGLQERP